MIIRKSRKYTVNMGDYNSFQFGAEVEFDTKIDMEEGAEYNEREILDTVNGALVESLQEEVAQAKLSPIQNKAMQALLSSKRK